MKVFFAQKGVFALKGTYKELNEIKKKIETWQNNDFVHPLTCGNNSLHADLVAHIEQNGEEVELFLVCEECDWKQDVPPFVIQSNLFEK